MDKHIDRKTTKAILADFLDHIYEPKEAEDPNRPATTPDDMKEGKPATTEVSKGDGTDQGAAGTEMTAEVNKTAPNGSSVATAPENSGDSTAVGIDAPPAVTTSESPADDIDKMDNVDPRVKEAAQYHASFIRLGNRVIDFIDNQWNQTAAKNASDKAELEEVAKRAAEMKAMHTAFLVQEFGMTPKQANDALNAIADQDPAAILPPEAINPEEAEGIIAEAAGEDAAAAGGDAVPAEDGTDPELEAEIDQFIEAARSEGLSDEEIADALEAAVTEEVGGEGEAAPEAAAPEAAPEAPADPTKVAGDDAPVPGDAPAVDAAAAPEAAPEGGEDIDAVQQQMEEAVNQMIQEGYSQEDIATALMDTMNISPDQVVDMVMDDLVQKGFSEEEATELLQNLGELEQQGLTPDQFAEAIDGPQA